jgi:probable rRNA maturation factor
MATRRRGARDEAALKHRQPSPQTGPAALAIGVSRDPGTPRGLNAPQFRRAVTYVLRQHACRAARIDVALVDDRHIAELNQRYLAHTGPTDVLSFDLSDAPVTGHPQGAIVLSWETAAREAARRGHSVLAEALLYAVHGTLHLLGYDDRTRRDAARMHAEENRILTALGWGAVYGQSAAAATAARGERSAATGRGAAPRRKARRPAAL